MAKLICTSHGCILTSSSSTTMVAMVVLLSLLVLDMPLGTVAFVAQRQSHTFSSVVGTFSTTTTTTILTKTSVYASSSDNNDNEAKNEGLEGDDDDVDVDDDDDEDAIQPYGNRSVAWTKRYRKLNPYEKVRQRVLAFGHRSKADWDDCVSSGQQGAYVPARPDEMYAPEWVGWEEFLGIMRSYESTQHIALHVLGLKSLDEYIIFVRQDPKRAEGLRIPVRPDLFYKDEWISEDDFFQTKKKKKKKKEN